MRHTDAHRSSMDLPQARTTAGARARALARPLRRANLVVLSLVLLAPSWAAAQTFTVATDRSQAGYTVSEKVVGLSLPRDAVGVTELVSGTVVLAADGRVAEGSKLTVDLRGLTSDAARRDRFIQNNTLETARYPEAVLVPTELRGLPSPLPTSGTASFQIVGDLTVHGTTRTVTWEATGDFSEGAVSLEATTEVTFDDFGLRRPVVGPILAVSDPIRLDVKAVLQRSAD